MSIGLEKLLNTFEKEDIILNTVNKMSPRERKITSLALGLIINTINDNNKLSSERRDALIAEISLFSKMSDVEWEEKYCGK